MLNNFLPCSKETLYEQINIQQPSSLERESKISSEVFELPHYQPSHRLASDPLTIKKVITLASIKHNNEIELNEQALELIHSYSKYQLIFCGVYGSKRSGKSVFLDKILNIDSAEDRGFKQTSNYEQIQCLRMNKQPLSIDDNKKIFFVEYCKGFQTTVLSEEEQKLLDMLIIISNSMIVLINKSGVTDKMSKQIGQTALRFQIKDKGCSYWPQNLYTVCVERNLGRDRSAIDYFFRRNSLVLYTNGQMKHLFELLEDISLTTNSKSYNNMEINGHLMVKLMMRIEQELNKIQIGSGINMPEVFEQIFLELYEQSYKYHTELYDETLQRYFDEERPYCIDYLIQAFYESRETTLQSFHTFPIARQRQLEYEQKLLDYIDQRERLIIEVNKKKSQFQLKQESEIKQFPKNKFLNKEDVQDVIDSTRKMHNKFEHAGIQTTSYLLLQLVKQLEKGEKKLRKRQEQTNAEQIKDLEADIKQKSQQLSILKNQRLMKEANKRELAQQYKKVQQRDRQLLGTISRLLKEIDIEKKNNKDLLLSKKAQQEKTDKMLELIRQLQQKQRENEKHMRQIEAEYDFNPDIERLQRQLERTERHLQNQFSKLESGITYSQLQPKESKFLPNKENKNNYNVRVGSNG